jgi:hypothetical protein
MHKPIMPLVATVLLLMFAYTKHGNAQSNSENRQTVTADTSAENSQTENGDNDVLQNAMNFALNGVKLGVDSEAFIKKCPQAQRQTDEDAKYGEVTYEIVSESGNKSNGYYFLDGCLFLMNIIYTAEGMSHVGGVNAFAEHIVSKLGKADANSPGQHPSDSKYSSILWWDFRSSIGRYFELDVTQDNAVIFKIFDNKKKEVLSKRKLADSDVGF